MLSNVCFFHRRISKALLQPNEFDEVCLEQFIYASSILWVYHDCFAHEFPQFFRNVVPDLLFEIKEFFVSFIRNTTCNQQVQYDSYRPNVALEILLLC